MDFLRYTKYCLWCSYPLTGLVENRCPECGREFDANDRTTYALDNRYVGPPRSGAPFIVGGAAGLALMLYSLVVLIATSGGLGWFLYRLMQVGIGVSAASVISGTLAITLTRRRYSRSLRTALWIIGGILAAWLGYCQVMNRVM